MPLLLFVCFLALPVLEIYIILQIGALIGTWLTVGLLVADSLAGAWVVRREGLRTWQVVRETLSTGAVPDRELADAALILVGGALLLTPGFVTDAFGFVAVLPFMRPLLRRSLAAAAKRRLDAQARMYTSSGPGGAGPYDGRFGGQSRVVRGDVVGEDRDDS